MDLSSNGASILLKLVGEGTKTGALASDPTWNANITYSEAFTNGGAASQANLLYGTSGTITSGATGSIDLFGTTNDVFGDTINAKRIKGFIFENTTTGAAGGIINVGNGTGATPFTFTDTTGVGIPVRPNGCMGLGAIDATAYAITSGSNEILYLAHTGGTGSATYKAYFLLTT